ncbi:hypothetical protein PSSHI_26950 [Photobacterium sp. R1]
MLTAQTLQKGTDSSFLGSRLVIFLSKCTAKWRLRLDLASAFINMYRYANLSSPLKDATLCG